MGNIHWSKLLLIVTLLCESDWAIGEPMPSAIVPSSATPQSKQESEPTDVKIFGDWVVRCFPIKSLAQCDMFQASSDKATQRRIMSVSIAYVPSMKGYFAKIIVPLGVEIAAGATIATETYRSNALAFVRCEDNGCYIEDSLNPMLVEKLMHAKSASVTITSYSGRGVALPLSMRGFSDAAAAMNALALRQNDKN